MARRGRIALAATVLCTVAAAAPFMGSKFSAPMSVIVPKRIDPISTFRGQRSVSPVASPFVVVEVVEPGGSMSEDEEVRPPTHANSKVGRLAECQPLAQSLIVIN